MRMKLEFELEFDVHPPQDLSMDEIANSLVEDFLTNPESYLYDEELFEVLKVRVTRVDL